MGQRALLLLSPFRGSVRGTSERLGYEWLMGYHQPSPTEFAEGDGVVIQVGLEAAIRSKC